MDWFNLIAGISSIAGLFITVWVLLKVRTIEKVYTSQALLPGFQRKLNGFIKRLKEHEERKNSAEIRKLLVLCCGTLCDLSPHLKLDRENRTSLVIVRINEMVSLKDNNALWKELGVIIAEIEAVYNMLGVQSTETKWRVPNA